LEYSERKARKKPKLGLYVSRNSTRPMHLINNTLYLGTIPNNRLI